MKHKNMNFTENSQNCSSSSRSRIAKLIKESLAGVKPTLKEYSLPEKNTIIATVNQLVLATPQASNPQELERKLNTVLEFYRYHQNDWSVEDLIVFNEFKNKLLNLAKAYNITLK